MNTSTLMKLSVAGLLAIGAAQPVAAQWGSQTSAKTIYSKNGEIAQLLTARTADGYTYLSWWEWNTEWSPASSMMLCMQLLDPQGNCMWGEDGIVVDSYPTKSYTSMNSLIVDKEGNAYVSWADSRSQIDKILTDEDQRYDNFEPVIYKINKDAEFLWGEDGLTLDPSKYSMSPILYQAGDNIYASIYGIGSGSYIASYFVRLNPETGEFMGEPQSMGGQYIASAGNDIINVYSSGGQTLAMRYNQNLQPVWSAPSVVAPFVYEGHSNFPYTLKTDYLGGVIVSLERNTSVSKWMPVVNYITADGESTFGTAVDVVETEENNNTYNFICYNPQTESILNVWGISNPTLALGAQLMDLFGDREWGENGLFLATKQATTGYSFAPLSVMYTEDNLYWILYVDETNWQQDTMYLICVDGEGNVVSEAQRVGAYNQGINNPAIYWEDGSMFIIYYNWVNNTGEYRIRTLSKTDFYESPEIPELPGGGSDQPGDNPGEGPGDDPDAGIESIVAGTGKIKYYSPEGLELNSPKKGLNIVKGADGEVRKVIIK